MGEQLKTLLSDLFLKKGIYVKGLEQSLMITITRVDVSSDLRHAKVFLTFINSSEGEENIITHLNRNSKNYKFIIGKKIRLKRIPEIKFFHDKIYNQPIGI